MADGPQIHHRLHRVDEIGKTGFEGIAVDVVEQRLPARQFGNRMEDDEARSVGDEIGDRLAASLKARTSVRVANDLRRVPKFLGAVLCDGVIGDAKGFGLLGDLQIADDRDCRCPNSCRGR